MMQMDMLLCTCIAAWADSEPTSRGTWTIQCSLNLGYETQPAGLRRPEKSPSSSMHMQCSILPQQLR